MTRPPGCPRRTAPTTTICPSVPADGRTAATLIPWPLELEVLLRATVLRDHPVDLPLTATTIPMMMSHPERDVLGPDRVPRPTTKTLVITNEVMTPNVRADAAAHGTMKTPTSLHAGPRDRREIPTMILVRAVGTPMMMMTTTMPRLVAPIP